MARIKQGSCNVPEISVGVSKVDVLNMESSGKSLKDCTKPIIIKGIAIKHSTDEDGDPITKGFIVGDDGTAYGTVSVTAIRSLSNAADLLVDAEGDGAALTLEATVVHGKTKDDTEFITLSYREV